MGMDFSARDVFLCSSLLGSNFGMEGMEGASRADLRVEFKRSELNVFDDVSQVWSRIWVISILDFFLESWIESSLAFALNGAILSWLVAISTFSNP